MVNTQLLSTVLIRLLAGRTSPFRLDLNEFSKVIRNDPKRKYFDIISDALTFNSTITAVGEWCVAEVEGLDVQFNPIVECPDVPITLGTKGTEVTKSAAAKPKTGVGILATAKECGAALLSIGTVMLGHGVTAEQALDKAFDGERIAVMEANGIDGDRAWELLEVDLGDIE